MDVLWLVAFVLLFLMTIGLVAACNSLEGRK
jgi:hypothetical protein